MDPYQQRVIDEKKALDEKLDKLVEFMKGDIFVRLDSSEVERLRRQAAVMHTYSAILSERIAHFKST